MRQLIRPLECLSRFWLFSRRKRRRLDVHLYRAKKESPIKMSGPAPTPMASRPGSMSGPSQQSGSMGPNTGAAAIVPQQNLNQIVSKHCVSAFAPEWFLLLQSRVFVWIGLLPLLRLGQTTSPVTHFHLSVMLLWHRSIRLLEKFLLGSSEAQTHSNDQVIRWRATQNQSLCEETVL